MGPKTAAVISGVMLLLLGLDTIPLPIAAQIAPAASLVALVALPLALRRFRITPLFLAVLAFFAYVLLHSVLALIVDFGMIGQPVARATTWVRQLLALTAGLSVFLVLRVALQGSSEARIRRLVLLGAAPAVAVGLVNLVWGVTGSGAAAAVVRGVRSIVAPHGFTAPFRASGLSLEPALFALFLGLVVIPMLVLGLRESRRKALLLAYLFLVLLAFAWTLSATGAAVLFILCGLGVLWGPERLTFGGALGAAAVGVVLLVLAVPNNYAVAQVGSLFRGELDLSATTKFFSTLEPVTRMPSSLVPIGYGLGGSPFHLDDVLSETTYRDIVSISWQNAPNLKTLWGRVLTETGLFGVALILAIVVTAAWQARSLSRRALPQEGRLALMAVPVAVAYLLGATAASGLGSFALPTLWFWLAVLDSRYVQVTAAPRPGRALVGTVEPAPV